MAFSLRFTGDGLPRFEAAVKALGESKAKNAYRMALNDTNRKVYTQVKRTVAKQMGVTQAVAVKRGDIRKKSASNGNLEAAVKSDGGYLELKDFKPNQGKKGVAAGPWGKRRSFPGTFIVGSIGGGVFKRTGKWNKKAGRFNGIEKLFGPAVPREIVKDASAEAFDRVARTVLPEQIARQIKRLSGGAIS